MSFKIPCGGFKLDEKSFSLDENGVLSVSGGGGSIPKPLTYDYMPEGYPSKSVETVTLMEEQGVTFSNMGGSAYMALSPVQFDISDGKTYTIVWDGVEYSCVGHATTEVGNYIGNPEALGGESTGEPFLYLEDSVRYMWASYDTATSHTIGVTGPDTVYKTIDKKFLPEAEKFVVDATNLPSNTTGWGNLSDSLRAAIDAGTEIFLDVYGDGKTLLKLTNAKAGEYLFIYPKSINTVSAYVLECTKSDGGELKNYDIYTHTGTT